MSVRVKAELRSPGNAGETVPTKWGDVTFDAEGRSSLEVGSEDLELLKRFGWLRDWKRVDLALEEASQTSQDAQEEPLIVETEESPESGSLVVDELSEEGAEEELEEPEIETPASSASVPSAKPPEAPRRRKKKGRR